MEEASEGGDEPDLHVQRDLAPGDVEGRKGDSAWERVLCVKAPWDSGRGMVDRNHSRLSEAAQAKEVGWRDMGGSEQGGCARCC